MHVADYSMINLNKRVYIVALYYWFSDSMHGNDEEELFVTEG